MRAYFDAGVDSRVGDVFTRFSVDRRHPGQQTAGIGVDATAD